MLFNILELWVIHLTVLRWSVYLQESPVKLHSDNAMVYFNHQQRDKKLSCSSWAELHVRPCLRAHCQHRKMAGTLSSLIWENMPFPRGVYRDLSAVGRPVVARLATWLNKQDRLVSQTRDPLVSSNGCPGESFGSTFPYLCLFSVAASFIMVAQDERKALGDSDLGVSKRTWYADIVNLPAYEPIHLSRSVRFAINMVWPAFIL